MSNKQEMPDFTKMTMTERLSWIKKLEQDTIAASQKEYEDAINYTVKQAKSLGRSVLDVATSMVVLLSDEERATFMQQFKQKRGPGKGPAAKRAPGDFKDADSDGKRPEAGTRYKLPGGQVWEKKSKLGAANKEFLAHIKDNGVTWASIKA